MGKNYTKKSTRSRSRRKDPQESNTKATVSETTVQLSLPIAEVLASVSDSIESLAGQTGLLVIKALLEDEVDRKVGTRYEHTSERTAFRHGHEDGYIVFAGRKVPVRRPRIRSVDGQE